MTATPYRNQANDYVAILEILDVLELLGGRDYFVQRYCNGFKLDRGWATRGASNTAELNRALHEICLVRRTDAEVDIGVPQQHPPRFVDVAITNRSEYDRATTNLGDFLFQRNLGIGFEDHPVETRDFARFEEAIRELDAAAKAPALVLQNVQRQLVEQGKVAHLLRHLESCREADRKEKIVVFAQFRETIDAIKAAFPNCAVIHGGETAKERFQQKERFQKDPDCTVIACSLKSGAMLDPHRRNARCLRRLALDKKRL
jgi:hypothetical protein